MAMKEYEVGYGKPPPDGRFKPGQSGNPKGRPKGTKNLKTDLAEELGEKIPIKEQGKTKKVSKQRAMLKALTAKALQGDTKAANTVLNLVMRLMTPDDVEGEEMELTKTDLQVLDEFKAAVISAASDENEGGSK